MENPIFFKITIKNYYNWLWIKYVNGFTSKTHCMNCLVGHRSLKIPPRSKSTFTHPYAPGTEYFGMLNEANFKYVYLCGVTENYPDNLHVVVRHAPGKKVVHEDKYCRVEMTNAERLVIPKISEPIERGPHFTTCRNFQFGYAYLRHTDPWDGKPLEEVTKSKKPSKRFSKAMDKRVEFLETFHRIRKILKT